MALGEGLGADFICWAMGGLEASTPPSRKGKTDPKTNTTDTTKTHLLPCNQIAFETFFGIKQDGCCVRPPVCRAEAIALHPDINSPIKLNNAKGCAAFIKRRGRTSSLQPPSPRLPLLRAAH